MRIVDPSKRRRRAIRRCARLLACLLLGSVVAGEAAAQAPATTRAATTGRGAMNGFERTDPNSRAAHAQLLEKAKQGRIDVYFVGDSITRRWGTSDAMYQSFYANWKSNFWGWNAGNFGWGADGLQNILWRMRNGELDGVNPKVIVFLGGTNDVGGRPPADAAAAQARVKAITAVQDRLIETFREKAPGATIILTGIFPRNDNPDARATVIDPVNAHLAGRADGKSIRYVNINDQLVDDSGKMRPGMSTDGLHLDVKGYQAWADALKPHLTEILGAPKDHDDAPPPTGDPSAAQNKRS